MNKQEWMFNKLSQECVEVSKEVSKVLEFGVYGCNPNDYSLATNQQRVEHELNDLMGVIDIMLRDGYLNKDNVYCLAGRNDKILKVLNWMEHAKKTGALE